MIMTLPHDFAILRNSSRLPVLLIGSGFSSDIVPRIDALMIAKKNHVEVELGCGCQDIDMSETDAFYKWCDMVLQNLPEQIVPYGKLRLSEALGLTTDERWLGLIGLPIRGTTPHHRVVARLAKESRLDVIWSWNWDTLLEGALEQIGFKRGIPSRRQPWRTGYVVTVIGRQFRDQASKDVLQVYKPHGCVQALIDASELYRNGKEEVAIELADRLKISYLDMNPTEDTIDETDTTFHRKLQEFVRIYPLIIAGWRASEPYARKLVAGVASRDVSSAKVGELTIIDPHFNPDGHAEITEAFGLAQTDVHIPVSPNLEGPTTDHLMLWIQTKYALDRLAEVADPFTSNVIVRIRDEIPEPGEDSPLHDWVDDFLPVWTQLCWRGGIISIHGFRTSEIRLEERDHYVPLDVQNVDRVELKVASKLLLDTFQGDCLWAFDEFPGGYWNQETMRLVLPLPAWKKINNLQSLRSLGNTLHQKYGSVRKVLVYPMDESGSAVPEDSSVVWDLRAKVADLLPVAAHALPESVGIVTELGSLEA